MVTEHLLSTDRLNRPRTLKDRDAVATLLNRLILMEPGSNPLHPEMGVGLISRFRHADVDDLEDLEDEIKEQISIYMLEYKGVDVNCSIYNGDIRVGVTLDGTLFTFSAQSGNMVLMDEANESDIDTEEDDYSPDDFSEDDLLAGGYYDDDENYDIINALNNLEDNEV